MTNAQRNMALIKTMYNMIFQNKALNATQWGAVPKPVEFAADILTWVPRTFVNGTVRGIDIDVNDDGRVLMLRFMEQNPNKIDKAGNLKETAIRARNGEFIMWLIDKKKQTDAFLGSMQNGKWEASKPRAYTTANNQAAAGAALNGPAGVEIPGIPGGMSTAEYVVQTMGAEEALSASEYGLLPTNANGDIVLEGSDPPPGVAGAYDVVINGVDNMDGFDPDIYDNEEFPGDV